MANLMREILPGATTSQNALPQWETMPVKRNLTIQLDDDVINDVKAVAARRGASVSGLVSAYLAQLTAADSAYERARQSALDLLAQIEHSAVEGIHEQPWANRQS